MWLCSVPYLVSCWGVLVHAAAAVASAELRPSCPANAGARCQDESDWTPSGDKTYKVDGHDVFVNYVVGTRFEMQCDNVSRSAEHPALLRFPVRVFVRTVKLWSCSPPALPYARVLAALNISVTDELQLHRIPATPPLRDDHFAELSSLESLTLYGDSTPDSPLPRLPRKLLAPLTSLRNLILAHVQPEAALESLPVRLYSLQLLFTGTELLTPLGASGLRKLLVNEEGAVTLNVTGGPALQSLTLASSKSSVIGLKRLGTLRTLGIDHWHETHPEPWANCGALEQVLLMDNASLNQTVLPGGWVARCPVLTHLKIQRVPLVRLPSRLLENATALDTLKLSGCQLEELPWDLFNDSVRLMKLDLSYNRLKSLPQYLFMSLRTLQHLDLTHNLLTVSVALVLQPLSTLRTLQLADNVQLSDLCEDGTDSLTVITNRSQLMRMTQLTTLILRNTSVSRVCRDWRESMPRLAVLDLTETKVTLLKYEDVVQRRFRSGAKMLVGGNYTVRFKYSAEDYEREMKGLTRRNDVLLILKSSIVCDCNAYWAALVFRQGARHAHLKPPNCSGKKFTLSNVSLDELTCARPDLCAGLQGCSCVSRDDSFYKNVVATAHCESHGLTAVPSPLSPGIVWRLLLSNNSISAVNVSELPPQLLELDLRNNTIEGFEEAAAAALQSFTLRLQNNPLRCECDALGLLTIVRRNLSQMENVTCSNRSTLASPKQMASICPLEPAHLVSGTLVAALALVSVAAAAVLVTVLVRSETRLRVKILLERVGCVSRRGRRGAEEAEDGRLYDVFVSHAHEDEEWVRTTLVDRLESGAAPYRLCVHYRDWAPGEWIPAQIAASVRASRRTLAVVSRHFLKSDWARLEFREAHVQARRDVTPRLLVLLLEDPALLPLDAEMRAFIENNTYIRWGDPWFWRKLERAMPPRPRNSDKVIRSCPSPAPAESPSDLQQSSRTGRLSQTHCPVTPRVLVPPDSPDPAQHLLAR